MRYTLQTGVKSPYSERVTDNLRYILPLVVVLAGLLFYLLAPKHSIKNANPLTLGIYTVKSSSPKSGSNSDNNKKNDQNTGAPSNDAQPISAQSGVANVAPVGGSSGLGYSTTSLASTGTTTPTTGGLGGGGLTGTGGTTTGGTGGTGGTTGGTGGTTGGTGGVTTTVTCDNTGGILPYTCTACTPPLLVPVGQKVLLSSTGSCTLLN